MSNEIAKSLTLPPVSLRRRKNHGPAGNAKTGKYIGPGVASRTGRRRPLWMRTGAGPAIGFGHLRRTLILARLLHNFAMPIFLLDDTDNGSASQVKAAGFRCLRFESARRRLPHDRPSGLLVDTRIETGLMALVGEARRRSVPVISLHDLGLTSIASDIAIDGSLLPFHLRGSGVPARRYGGTSYLVLDPAFGRLHRRARRWGAPVSKVVINSGGGNAAPYFPSILRGLRAANMAIEVVGMPGFASWGQEHLERADWKPLQFRWAGRDENIAALMATADCAITAGGLAAYEALCVGTPLCAFSYDRFQKLTVDAMARAGACLDLGPGAGLSARLVTSHFLRLAADPGLRWRLSERGRELVDGRGARRVAGIVRRYLSQSGKKGARRIRS